MSIQNIVFEGGGVKGIAYVGALQALEENGTLDQVDHVAGTSAGAITSCLVSLRYSAAIITEKVKKMDLGSFDDKEGLLKKLHYYGLHPGNTFLDWIRAQITGAGLNLKAEATFQDFHQAGCRDLRVFASDIYTHKVQEFSYQSTPNTIVAEAVRASMSIPLYFNAWKFSNNIPNDHLYVDGGMVYNYPITAFDVDGELNKATLGFRLEDINGKSTVHKFGYGHWKKYVQNTFETLLRSQNIDFKKNKEQVSQSVIIDDLGIKATDFNIDEKTKEALIQNGKTATEAYFKNHS